MKRVVISIVVLITAVAVVIAVVLGELNRSPQGAKGTDREYKISDDSPLAENRVEFKITERLSVPLERPAGIAAGPDGSIYVCGKDGLVIFDGLTRSPAKFNMDLASVCLAVDEAGVVFLGFENGLGVFDPGTGDFQPWADLDERAIITSITVSENRVYAADAGNRAILVYDKQGMRLDRYRGFLIPSPYFDVALDPMGELWAADTGRHELRRIGSDGAVVERWGHYAMDVSGFSGCCNPAHFSVTSDGLFITSEKGLQWIKAYSRSGEFLGIVADRKSIGGNTEGLDLAPAIDGGVFVLLSNSREVYVYERVTDG